MTFIDVSAPTDAVVRRVFHEIETEVGFGMVPNIFKSMAECPPALAAHWAMFKHTILEGELLGSSRR